MSSLLGKNGKQNHFHHLSPTFCQAERLVKPTIQEGIENSIISLFVCGFNEKLVKWKEK
jgi:hypothetical protein